MMMGVELEWSILLLLLLRLDVSVYLFSGETSKEVLLHLVLVVNICRVSAVQSLGSVRGRFLLRFEMVLTGLFLLAMAFTTLS